MAEFLMPSLGADMDEGTVLEWLVEPGQHVDKGDVVAVVDTAKAAVDVECFATGTVRELLVPAGEKVPVGTPLARIDTEPGAVPATPAAPLRPPRATPPVRTFAAQSGVDLATVHGTGRDGAITRADVQRAIPPAAQPAAAPPGPARPKVSPHARRLARTLGVDIATVPTTAPDGAIHARDVRAASAGRTPSAGRQPDTAAMREAIAALMARSKREIPHYYLATRIDLGDALSWMRERNRQLPVSERLVPAALLLKATALAVTEVPELNGFRAGEAVHLGVTVSLRGGGLVTPALADAAGLSLTETMRRLRDLVSRARSGRLRASELTSATITVTNLGDNGVESVQGVIYPPQVALVGFGAVTEQPWVIEGRLAVRPVVAATLAADHRATDGATGARLLNAIATKLRTPEEL